MAGVKCIYCNYIGTLENQDVHFNGKTDDMPISRFLKYKGHNPFSGNLHYECPRCETMVVADPMDVLGAVGAEIITDVREKQRENGYFKSFFLSQKEETIPFQKHVPKDYGVITRVTTLVSEIGNLLMGKS